MTGARPDTWMPFYVGDYLRDTGHLSPAEHGAYILLILHYWTTSKPLPDDRELLRRICRMTQREWVAARNVIEPFFTIEDGEWRHSRIDKELSKSSAAYASRCARTEAARQEKQRRIDERNKAAGTIATVIVTKDATKTVTGTQPQPQPDSLAKKDANESLGAQVAPTSDMNQRKAGNGRGTRLAADWQPSEQDREFAAEHGFRNDTCKSIAARFRDFWLGKAGPNAVKRDWPATWRNWVRTEAERGQPTHAHHEQRPGGQRQGPASVVSAFGALLDDGADGGSIDG